MRNATDLPAPGITFTLPVYAPFRLDITVWALRRQPANGIDHWDGTTYRRKIVVDDHLVDVAVSQRNRRGRNDLKVALACSTTLAQADRQQILFQVRRLLGLDIHLGAFYRFAGRDPLLDPLIRPFVGLRPPRYATLFEAMVNAVACQQISLPAGLALLNRFSNRFGRGIGCDRAFPQPHDVYENATLQKLRELGFSFAKSRALLHLTGAIALGTLDEESLERLDNQQAIDRLTALPGIGRWSAEYVLLRGLGRLSVFPGDDVGARNQLARWLNVESVRGYAGVAKLLRRWHPHEGLIYFHLLLWRLHQEGWLAVRKTEFRAALAHAPA